jgi:hypothetical protein
MAPSDDMKLRYLADIQLIIARLSQNSFIIRGWSVTLVSIIFAIVSTQRADNRGYALLALPPALIFWALDAYYLRRERSFRRLYAAVGQEMRAGLIEQRLFDMDTGEFETAVPSFFRTLLAGHVVAIPAMLIALAVGLASLAL